MLFTACEHRKFAIARLLMDAYAGEAAALEFMRKLSGRHPQLLLRCIREAQAAGELAPGAPRHILLFLMASVGLPVVLAGLAFTGDLLFWHASILRTHVANATFFATTAPIWVVAFGWALFGRRAGRGVLAGLALCLLGGAALLGQTLRLQPQNALGDAFGLATGVFFGLYFLAVEAARREAGAARFDASSRRGIVLEARAGARSSTG